MTDTIIILTEAPLGEVDVENITGLFADSEQPELIVLVPDDVRRNLLVDVIDQLSLLDLPAALKEFGGRESKEEAKQRAESTLQTSLAALQATGATVSGKVFEGDAVAGLVAEVEERSARQAVVVTEPHALEDTFHTDWATRAQDKLGLPVLHLYSGSGFIGDS
ncbi:hypothetical protein [Psychromicrobium lacuslunae]|uniref:UspA domain-containing protein n=1 Tax=Psychromicrobium lacuslunae TaxID=1618207 RepID=A0A0D4BXE4_9MICC|nr:hypothetical protein [Psychromicrobium lacuslunae]AJT40800.1 hypothetical protein UM93_03405 [Psychromicrobium lacuslunae]